MFDDHYSKHTMASTRKAASTDVELQAVSEIDEKESNQGHTLLRNMVFRVAHCQQG